MKNVKYIISYGRHVNGIKLKWCVKCLKYSNMKNAYIFTNFLEKNNKIVEFNNEFELRIWCDLEGIELKDEV